MTEEIEAHVLKKYEILQKLGKFDFSFALWVIIDANVSHFLKGKHIIVHTITCDIIWVDWLRD